MTLSTEIFEANLATAANVDTIVTLSSDQTIVGTLDARQLTFPTSAANAATLGLDETTVRGDIYGIQVTEGETYSIEIAINGGFGGTLDQIGFTISGDNGTTRPGFSLRPEDLTLLTNSSSATGALFQQDFSSADHDFLYVTLLADASDQGTYSLSVATSPEAVGDDTVIGTNGDDVLFGYRGDDTVNGGAGEDIATYQQNDEFFTLQLGSEITLTDRGGNEGADVLNDIENLGFLDRDFRLQDFDDVADLSAEEFSTFTEMYIAYFNRAPDAEGLMFWANTLGKGLSIEEIASIFAGSTEAQALYPDSAPASEFVEAIYTNALGRASDADGAAFWTSVLEGGFISRGAFVLQVLRGARVDPEPGATQEFIDQQLADRAYLDNKVDVGIYFSAILGMSDVEDAKAVMALYDGTVNSIQDAKAAADQDFAEAVATDGTGDFLVQLVGVIDDPFAIM